MSSRSDQKELLPFLALSAVIMLALPLLMTSQVLPLQSTSAEQKVGGLPVKPEPLNTGLDQLVDRADVRQKKRDFFALLKPMVRIENTYIQQQNLWLKQLNPGQLSEEQAQGFMTLLKDYQVLEDSAAGLPDDVSDLQALRDKLLVRVQPIPVELVLVQAANESAWGRSRFAREGNNLFGQWCFSRGCGLVPSQRPEGQYHEVAVFKSPQLSIRAYMRNLNGFWAYEDFRRARAEKPMLQGAEQALYLADHLLRYSQRGQAYVDELKEMVQVNSDLIEQAPDEHLR